MFHFESIQIIKNTGKWKVDSWYGHSKSASNIHIPMIVHIQHGLCHFCITKSCHIWNKSKHYDLQSNRTEAESPLIVSPLSPCAVVSFSLLTLQ